MGKAVSSFVKFSPKSRGDGVPPPPAKYPDYVSAPIEELHREFMKSVCILLLHHGLFKQNKRHEPALHFRSPDLLAKLVDLKLYEHGTSLHHLLAIIRKIMFYGPGVGHPYFMWQLLAGLDPYAALGDFVVAAIPASMYSYEDSPVYIMMEQQVSKKLRELAGYPEGTGACMFASSTAEGNIFSICLARQKKFPQTKSLGTMDLGPLVVFASQDAHCCVQKGAIYTGIGLENLISVATDVYGKMSVSSLIECVEKALADGQIPLMVCATSGTNPLGAFDPLEAISEVCKKYDMWLHSDGALGGGFIFSAGARKYRLNGMHLCDSFTGSLHKAGSATMTCSYMLTPHEALLRETFSMSTHSSEDYSSFDDQGPLCGREVESCLKFIERTRRPEIVKLFFMWQGKGLAGLGANIDNAYGRAHFFLEELKRRQNHNGKFVPVLEEFESPLISFHYVPPYMQKLNRHSIEFKEMNDLHTSLVMAELVKNGVMMSTVQCLRHGPMFFKFVLTNSAVTYKDIVYLLDQIDNYGTYCRMPVALPPPDIEPDEPID